MARILVVAIVILLMLPILVQVWWLTGIFDWLSLSIFLTIPLGVLLLSNRRVRAVAADGYQTESSACGAQL